MIIIKNWSLICTEITPYTPPELITSKLQGNVYGHPKDRFEDGRLIVTSTVVNLDIKNRKAETISGNHYELGEPDKKWLQWLRDNNFNKSLGEMFPN